MLSKSFLGNSLFLFMAPTFFGAVLCCTKTKGQPAAVAASVDTLRYQLVWSDEFNGTAIDTTAWVFETGNSGWGNNELQFYKAGNALITAGNLAITAKKEVAGTARYTSARMKTEGRKSFQYGRLEARIKIPLGQGLWPAFWALGANISSVGWPQCGELDIMEHINTDSLLYGTAHWNNNGHVSAGGKTTFDPNAYHIYAIEWDGTSITWYVDGVVYFTLNIADNANNTAGLHAPFFILLNLAVGGSWPGSNIDESKLPATMLVDYVRLYQKK